MQVELHVVSLGSGTVDMNSCVCDVCQEMAVRVVVSGSDARNPTVQAVSSWRAALAFPHTVAVLACPTSHEVSKDWPDDQDGSCLHR